MSIVFPGAARSAPNVAAPGARDARLTPFRALVPTPSCQSHHASVVLLADVVTSTGSTNRCGEERFCAADHGGSATAVVGSARARSVASAARERLMRLQRMIAAGGCAVHRRIRRLNGGQHAVRHNRQRLRNAPRSRADSGTQPTPAGTFGAAHRRAVL